MYQDVVLSLNLVLSFRDPRARLCYAKCRLFGLVLFFLILFFNLVLSFRGPCDRLYYAKQRFFTSLWALNFRRG